MDLGDATAYLRHHLALAGRSAEEYPATHEVGTLVFLILVAKAPARVWKVTWCRAARWS